MAFVKKRGPFTRTIEIQDGESYTLLLNIPTDAQMAAPLITRREIPSEAEGEPPRVVLESSGVIVGWEGVNDTETGEPLPFTPENLYEFLSDAPILGETWREIGRLHADAISGKLFRKNSSAPPATGPGETAPGPSGDANQATISAA